MQVGFEALMAVSRAAFSPGLLAFKDLLPPAFDERGHDKHQEEHRAGQRSAKIRCPLCDWQPKKDSRWFCISIGPPENYSGGCGHGWNTFDTRGRCPGCSHQWRYTTCFGCNRWSLHDDWYVQGGPGKP